MNLPKYWNHIPLKDDMVGLRSSICGDLLVLHPDGNYSVYSDANEDVDVTLETLMEGAAFLPVQGGFTLRGTISALEQEGGYCAPAIELKGASEIINLSDVLAAFSGQKVVVTVTLEEN